MSEGPSLSVKDLRTALRAAGLPTTGNKQTLQDRLDRLKRQQSAGSSPSVLANQPEGASTERQETGRQALEGTQKDGDQDRELLEAEKQLRLLTLRRDQARLEAEIRELSDQAGCQRQPASTAPPCEYPRLGDLVMGPVLGMGEDERPIGQSQSYRVIDFISSRKRQEWNKTGQAGTALSKQNKLDGLSVGDWITGNANALIQMLRDGRLVTVKDGKADMTELLEYLKHTAKVGDLLDLGFDRTRVLRYDDEYRIQQAGAGVWDSSVTDLGLVAAHLMAPSLQAGPPGRAAVRRTQVCFDFNRVTGCQRSPCRFSHSCRRCGLPHSEAAFHKDGGPGPKN